MYLLRVASCLLWAVSIVVKLSSGEPSASWMASWVHLREGRARAQHVPQGRRLSLGRGCQPLQLPSGSAPDIAQGWRSLKISGGPTVLEDQTCFLNLDLGIQKVVERVCVCSAENFHPFLKKKLLSGGLLLPIPITLLIGWSGTKRPR